MLLSVPAPGCGHTSPHMIRIIIAPPNQSCMPKAPPLKILIGKSPCRIKKINRNIQVPPPRCTSARTGESPHQVTQCSGFPQEGRVAAKPTIPICTSGGCGLLEHVAHRHSQPLDARPIITSTCRTSSPASPCSGDGQLLRQWPRHGDDRAIVREASGEQPHAAAAGHAVAARPAPVI